MSPTGPGDQLAVEAMVARSKQAERGRDPRWMPRTPPVAGIDEVDPDELGLWVAQPVEGGTIVGVVGLYRAELSLEIPANCTRAAGWRDRNDVADLRRLRVDPDWRRMGVATMLNQTVLDWARDNGLREVVLNTTSAQIPALAFYRILGFREIFRSFIGEYELVWMSRQL